jgi:hypothetical protein
MQFFNVTIVDNMVEVLGPYDSEEERDVMGQELIRRTRWEHAIVKLDAAEKPIVRPYEFFDPLAIRLPPPPKLHVFDPDK